MFFVYFASIAASSGTGCVDFADGVYCPVIKHNLIPKAGDHDDGTRFKSIMMSRKWFRNFGFRMIDLLLFFMLYQCNCFFCIRFQ